MRHLVALPPTSQPPIMYSYVSFNCKIKNNLKITKKAAVLLNEPKKETTAKKLDVDKIDSVQSSNVIPEKFSGDTTV